MAWRRTRRSGLVRYLMGLAQTTGRREWGHVPLVRVPVFQDPPEVREIRPDVEVARRDLLAQVGQHRGFARIRRASSPALPVAGNVDHDEPGRVADLPAVEDLHEVRVALARLDQEDEPPAAALELAAEDGLEAARRRDALPLAPAVDVARVRQGRGREPLSRGPARRLFERDAPLPPAVHRMKAERHEHGGCLSPLTSSGTPS